MCNYESAIIDKLNRSNCKDEELYNWFNEIIVQGTEFHTLFVLLNHMRRNKQEYS